jgi:uncharacterized UPF0146 family protein
VSDARHAALVDRLATDDTLVEVGIGNRPAVAAALADRGCTVTATDVSDREVPASVAFVRDDVTDPDPAVYADADTIYALNCPPELHRPVRDVAREADADFLFTTLGGDPPLVPVARESLHGTGETLFLAEGSRSG